MRWLAFSIVLAAASPAWSESTGYYGEVSSGPVRYRGDLAPLGRDKVKVHVGFVMRRGTWSYELITGGILNDTSNDDASGCPDGVQCRVVNEPSIVDMDVLGGNLRYRWDLGRTRWQRLGFFMSIYGGPRWYFGDGALDAYVGTGVGGGSRIEVDIFAIGYFIDVGVDAMRLDGPYGAQILATTPYVLFGGKVGWL